MLFASFETLGLGYTLVGCFVALFLINRKAEKDNIEEIAEWLKEEA